MKPLAICAVLLALLSGCQTNPAHMNNHWRLDTVTDRASYHAFSGYNSIDDDEQASSWWDVTALVRGIAKHEWSNVKHVSKTFTRHFLSYDPENPRDAFLR